MARIQLGMDNCPFAASALRPFVATAANGKFEPIPPMASDTSPILTGRHFDNSGVQVRLIVRKFQDGLACCGR